MPMSFMSSSRGSGSKKASTLGMIRGFSPRVSVFLPCAGPISRLYPPGTATTLNVGFGM